MPASKRCLATLAGLTGLILASLPLQADTPQQGWVGDLPIMSGMNIEPELGFAFDSPGGRIVLVFAAAEDSPDAILAYYDAALDGRAAAAAGIVVERASRWRRSTLRSAGCGGSGSARTRPPVCALPYPCSRRVKMA